MIEFKNIYKSYGGNNVLKDINFTCETDEITVLIGPSGCGKAVSEINPVELRRGIGYVIQHIGLFPHMTIEQNVSVVPNLLKWDTAQVKERVSELLSLVGLDPEVYKSRYPSELSGGQQQRIGVIRALAAEPSIILMDEPFSALDPISREQLQEELNRLQKEIKKTIVFVTHDMDEALKIADKIVLMKDGTVIQHATPEEILRRPANEFVKTFIGKKRLKLKNSIPTVSEVMVKKPAVISQGRGMALAMNLMESRQVDSLVVVDEQNRVQGYVSIYDVAREFDDEDKLVGDIMEPFTHSMPPDVLLDDGIHMLDQSELSYVPIMDSDNVLLGLLTRGSVVGHLKDVYSLDGSRGA